MNAITKILDLLKQIFDIPQLSPDSDFEAFLIEALEEIMKQNPSEFKKLFQNIDRDELEKLIKKILTQTKEAQSPDVSDTDKNQDDTDVSENKSDLPLTFISKEEIFSHTQNSYPYTQNPYPYTQNSYPYTNPYPYTQNPYPQTQNPYPQISYPQTQDVRNDPGTSKKIGQVQITVTEKTEHEDFQPNRVDADASFLGDKKAGEGVSVRNVGDEIETAQKNGSKEENSPQKVKTGEETKFLKEENASKEGNPLSEKESALSKSNPPKAENPAGARETESTKDAPQRIDGRRDISTAQKPDDAKRGEEKVQNEEKDGKRITDRNLSGTEQKENKVREKVEHPPASSRRDDAPSVAEKDSRDIRTGESRRMSEGQNASESHVKETQNTLQAEKGDAGFRKNETNFRQGDAVFQKAEAPESRKVEGANVAKGSESTRGTESSGRVERIVVEAMRKLNDGRGHVVISSVIDRTKVTVEAFQVSDRHIIIKVITSDQSLRAEVSRNFDFLKGEAEKFGFTVISFDVSAGGEGDGSGKDFLQTLFAGDVFRKNASFEEHFSHREDGTTLAKINLKGKINIVA